MKNYADIRRRHPVTWNQEESEGGGARFTGFCNAVYRVAVHGTVIDGEVVKTDAATFGPYTVMKAHKGKTVEKTIYDTKANQERNYFDPKRNARRKKILDLYATDPERFDAEPANQPGAASGSALPLTGPSSELTLAEQQDANTEASISFFAVGDVWLARALNVLAATFLVAVADGVDGDMKQRAMAVITRLSDEEKIRTVTKAQLSSFEDRLRLSRLRVNVTDIGVMDEVLAALQHQDAARIRELMGQVKQMEKPAFKRIRSRAKDIFKNTATLFATLYAPAAQRLDLGSLDTCIYPSLNIAWYDKSFARNAAIARASESAPEAHRMLKEALVAAMPSLQEKIEAHTVSDEPPCDAKCVLYAWLHEHGCTRQPASNVPASVIDCDKNQFWISAERYPEFQRKYAECIQLQASLRDAMEPGTPLICLSQRCTERFPFFLEGTIDPAKQEEVVRALHDAVVKSFDFETSEFFVSQSRSGFRGYNNIRIHSLKEQFFDREKAAKLESLLRGIVNDRQMLHPPMLCSERAQVCATCKGTKKQCPKCVYGPFAVCTGCQPNSDWTSPDELLQTTCVFVNGELDQVKTDAQRATDFSRAVEQTSIWSRHTESQPVVQQGDQSPEWELDKEGTKRLVRRQPYERLDNNSEKVKHMTAAIREKHPKWKNVEPREVLFFPRTGEYIFKGEGEGASWCKNLGGAHENCSVYWRFSARGGGKSHQECFSNDARVQLVSSCKCTDYRGFLSGLRKEQVHSLWPKDIRRRPVQGAQSSSKKPKSAAEPAPSGQLVVFCEQLIEAHPDAEEHLADVEMALLPNGQVKLTLPLSSDEKLYDPDGTLQMDVAQDVEAVWSEIGKHIVRQHWRHFAHLFCRQMEESREMSHADWEAVRESLLKATQLEHPFSDLNFTRDFRTIRLMASSGHFVNLSSFHIVDGDLSSKEREELRSYIDRDTRNWPRLTELFFVDGLGRRQPLPLTSRTCDAAIA
mmetsp:Transcript_18625/g.37726  ORF Transcript_18625/g.37726 Transcript_18625/m.37726 type:complete len:978 (+) Transcript_18625:1794-4727(+)